MKTPYCSLRTEKKSIKIKIVSRDKERAFP